MGVPLVDLHVKYLVEFIIREVLKDPDKRIKEIFGDVNIDQHAALYGDSFYHEIKEWITTTNIPVFLGFELNPAQLPAVTVNLAGTSPTQQYLGDAGLNYQEPIPSYKRDVLVPKFIPEELTPSADNQYITLTLPSSLTQEQQSLVRSGFIIRDKKGQEFGIGEDKFNPTILEINVSFKNADFSEIEVISPIKDATYREGAMFFDENLLITVHGHSDRIEGIWLWAIVHWGILKYRSLLSSVFGMDLALPHSSDFAKDDSFLGENVWRRFITLSAKAVCSWEGPRRQDVVAFILDAKFGRKGNLTETVDISIDP